MQTRLSLKGDAHPQPCVAVRIGTLARLTPDKKISDITNAGYGVRLQLSTANGDSYVVVGATNSAPATAKSLTTTDLRPLLDRGVVVELKDVQSQSADPALASCQYGLKDRPAATQFVEATKQAGLARGLLTSADLANFGVELVTDDPFDSGALLVSLQIGVKGTPVGLAGSPMLMSVRYLVAIVDKAAQNVLAISSGYWY